MLHDAIGARRRRAGRDPLPPRPGPSGPRARGRGRPAGPAGAAGNRRGRRERLRARHRQAGRRRREGRRDRSPAKAIDVTVWDVRSCAPLDDEMLADAATPPRRGHRRGRRPRRRDRDDHRRPDRRAAPPPCRSTSWAYRPGSSRTGKPDHILGQLGLDADGIARTIREPADPGGCDLTWSWSADLELALELADAADAITLPAFQARRFEVERQGRRHRGHRRRPRRRGGDRRAARRRASRPRVLGEEFGRIGRGIAVAVDRRPDRRHLRLRARHPGVGDARSPSRTPSTVNRTSSSPPSRPRRSAPAGGRRGAPARSSTGVVVESRRSTG